MRIIKATSPPSLHIIVDFIIVSPIKLKLPATHALFPAIDIIFFVRNKKGITFGVQAGIPHASPCKPILTPDSTAIANVIRYPARSFILQEDIEELY